MGNSPCKKEAFWEPTTKKLDLPMEKVMQTCKKELDRLEEPFEAALADPTVRDAALRQKVCVAPKKKPACKALWSPEEVPVSRAKAEAMRAEADRKKEAERLKEDKLGKETTSLLATSS